LTIACVNHKITRLSPRSFYLSYVGTFRNLANVVQILALKNYVIETIGVSEWIRTMTSAFEGHVSSLCENAVPAAIRKVEQKAERHPNDEPFPGGGREL
jgi:hypothetical protein